MISSFFRRNHRESQGITRNHKEAQGFVARTSLPAVQESAPAGVRARADILLEQSERLRGEGRQESGMSRESPGIIRNLKESEGITRNQQESQGITRNHKESQGITRNQRESLGIPRNHKESQGIVARTSLPAVQESAPAGVRA